MRSGVDALSAPVRYNLACTPMTSSSDAAVKHNSSSDVVWKAYQ